MLTLIIQVAIWILGNAFVSTILSVSVANDVLQDITGIPYTVRRMIAKDVPVHWKMKKITSALAASLITPTVKLE